MPNGLKSTLMNFLRKGVKIFKMEPLKVRCGIGARDVVVEFDAVGYTTHVRCKYYKHDNCKLIGKECPWLRMVGKGHKPSLYGR